MRVLFTITIIIIPAISDKGGRGTLEVREEPVRAEGGDEGLQGDQAARIQADQHVLTRQAIPELRIVPL